MPAIYSTDFANRCDRQGSRCSNIVFDVAYNESENHVRAKAKAWLLTAPTQPQFGVQQVIVVKIGTNVRGSGHRTMKALRCDRASHVNPIQEIEFGHDGPNGGATVAGIPAMQIQPRLSPSASCGSVGTVNRNRPVQVIQASFGAGSRSIDGGPVSNNEGVVLLAS